MSRRAAATDTRGGGSMGTGRAIVFASTGGTVRVHDTAADRIGRAVAGGRALLPRAHSSLAGRGARLRELTARARIGSRA